VNSWTIKNICNGKVKLVTKHGLVQPPRLKTTKISNTTYKSRRREKLVSLGKIGQEAKGKKYHEPQLIQ
jgi:hypothetical protein